MCGLASCHLARGFTLLGNCCVAVIVPGWNKELVMSESEAYTSLPHLLLLSLPRSLSLSLSPTRTLPQTPPLGLHENLTHTHMYFKKEKLTKRATLLTHKDNTHTHVRKHHRQPLTTKTTHTQTKGLLQDPRIHSVQQQ